MGATAAITAISFIASSEQKKSAQKKQRQAAEIEQKRSDLSAQRERVKQVRQARIERGRIQAAGAQGAGTGGSGVAGGLAGVSSQMGANVSFLNQQQSMNQAISNLNISAANNLSNASTYQAIGSVASSFKGFNTKPSPQTQKLFDVYD